MLGEVDIGLKNGDTRGSRQIRRLFSVKAKHDESLR